MKFYEDFILMVSKNSHKDFHDLTIQKSHSIGYLAANMVP